MDANSKLGPDYIPGDKHPQSDNGRLLAGVIERHSLLIGNAHERCEGLITRKRVTKDAVEESTIDFVLMSTDLESEIDSIIVDDKRAHVLTKLAKTKSEVKKVESDHNSIVTKFKIEWKNLSDQRRIEIYNLKNKQCQQIFHKETSSYMNNNNLSSIFDTTGDLNNQTKKFLKKLEKVIHKCFKKIRIKERVDKEKEALHKKWKTLKNKNDEKSKEELKTLEKELCDKYAENYFEKIKEHVGNFECLDSNMKNGTL